jgi:TolB protein
MTTLTAYRVCLTATAFAVCTYAAVAAEPVRVTEDGRLKQRPVFSPNGEFVTFARHEADRILLYERNLATGEETRLTDGDGPEFDAVYAPDGLSLLYAFDRVSTNQGNMDVHRWTRESRESTNVIDDGGKLTHEESPCWSPDGSRIAFTSTRDGNQELYVSLPDGSEIVRLTSDPAIDAHPAWSPDGSQIAFATNRWGDLEIAVIAPDGSSLRRLTDSPGLDDYPAWSPDGTQLAWMSLRDGNAEIYLADRDGSRTRNLTNDPAIDNFPAWTPHRGLGFISNRDGGYELYLWETEPGD